ncbi:helix-turn-helix domain-containing protein [Streptomyces sp. TRM66268-LWL]|uniref:Helix-turn-helix domain-containing protein n=1 Tax=Streptomyces polyasparticus TaxID=2767826 RepID=A0ABR7SKE4_9ACTN|nr:helix-turn-helix domain-containing protein [Streptomyces polyasparticus]MBC9715897.1 helix-turn-helix domain-containing protein [Streptomyces polyasparticus]
MTDFDAIDALLASVQEETALPPAEERRRLREALGLSRTQVAAVLGVSASTVGGWESGREPSGEIRAKYGYFLEGAQSKVGGVADQGAGGTEPAGAVVAEREPGDEPEREPVHESEREPAHEPEPVHDPAPCVLCGAPAVHQVEGFAQHLDAAQCEAATSSEAGPREQSAAAVTVTPEAVIATPGRPATDTAATKIVPAGRRAKEADSPDLIARAVDAALAAHSGDVDAATAALVKRAIPDAMALLDDTRKGARYQVIAHPPMPDILRRKTAKGPDDIWEARPNWTRPELPAGLHEVTALDINGAYLSALKTHLPIGALEHSTGNVHDRRRAGVHLITPPSWDLEHLLPNPLGNRDEAGELWVTEPTLRLLLRLSSDPYGLCEPPVIHESWTSGATEGLLEKFRIALKDARDRAIAEDDPVTLEYVKAMYAKFVSTMGESNYNRELYRSDWMHLIRSQAFANLWMKAYKCFDEGLVVVRAMGTDELHVSGDWRQIFTEGRAVTEVKVKDVYHLGEREAELPADA